MSVNEWLEVTMHEPTRCPVDPFVKAYIKWHRKCLSVDMLEAGESVKYNQVDSDELTL